MSFETKLKKFLPMALQLGPAVIAELEFQMKSAQQVPIADCQEAAYAIAEEVIVPSTMIRDDIGEKTVETHDKLRELNLMPGRE